jgi:hypothetical protein
MILVDPQQHQHQQHGWQELGNRLDSEIAHILKSKTLPEDEKAKQYLLVLRRFLSAKRQQEELTPVPVKIVSGETIEDKDAEFQPPASKVQVREQRSPKVVKSQEVQLTPVKQHHMEQQTTPKQILSKLLPTFARPSTSKQSEEEEERTVKGREAGEFDKYSMDNLIQDIPADRKAKAHKVLSTIEKKGGNLQWDPDTGCLLSKGKPLADTNMADILKFLLKTGDAPQKQPSGYEQVAEVLFKEQKTKRIQSGTGLSSSRQWCAY